MYFNLIDEGGGVKSDSLRSAERRFLAHQAIDLCQAEHILHAVEAWPLFREPLGGANSAAGEGVAAVGAVDEFESLADAAEDDGVLADDVAGADGKQRNFFLDRSPTMPLRPLMPILSKSRFSAFATDRPKASAVPLGASF